MSAGTGSATDPESMGDAKKKPADAGFFHMLRWLTRSESSAALSFLSL